MDAHKAYFTALYNDPERTSLHNSPAISIMSFVFSRCERPGIMVTTTTQELCEVCVQQRVSTGKAVNRLRDMGALIVERPKCPITKRTMLTLGWPDVRPEPRNS